MPWYLCRRKLRQRKHTLSPDEPKVVSDMYTACQEKSITVDTGFLRSALGSSFAIVSFPIGSAIISFVNATDDAGSRKS